jgi:RIO-like serine/threonine protein kinase
MNNIDEMKKNGNNDLGYNIVNFYSDDKYVCIVSDKNGNEFISKQYRQSPHVISWERTKELYKEFETLNIGPKIHEILDEEQICIMERGYKTYLHYLNNEKIKERVMNMIDVLHKNGYIHGDLHKNNIIIRKDDTPFLIDFESTIKWGKDDISTIYGSKELSTFEDLVKFDLRTLKKYIF